MKQHIDGHVKLMIMQHLQDQGDLLPNELLMVFAILRDAKGFHPSVALLAKRVGVSPTFAKKLIKRIIEKGVIYRESQKGNQVAHYSVNLRLLRMFGKYFRRDVSGLTEAEVVWAEQEQRWKEAQETHEKEEGEAADLRARLNADAGIPYHDYPGDWDE